MKSMNLISGSNLKRMLIFYALISACLISFSCKTAPMADNPAGKKADKPKAEVNYSKMEKGERIKDAEKRRGAYYAKRLSGFIEQTPNCQTGGIVFVGDSITEGFPLDSAFKGKNVINRGISGDKIEGVYERLDVSVEKLAPAKVYLMIGINDLFQAPPVNVEGLGNSYAKLVAGIKKAAPNAEFSVFSILPVGPTHADKKMNVQKLNQIIIAICKRENVKFIDLYPKLSDAAGDLKNEYSSDEVHLSLEGYIAWLEVFNSPSELFECVLGLSEKWFELNCGNSKVSKIDPQGESQYPGGRGVNELIVYTPKYGKPTTGTNEWGYEAIVVDGIVKEHKKNNSKIPSDGYVISGHAAAGGWIKSNLPVGTKITYTPEEIKILSGPQGTISQSDKLRGLQKELLNTIYQLKTKNAPADLMSEAKTIFQKIRVIDNPNNSEDADIIKEIETRINKLKGQAAKL